jgi:superkiller protein 8
MNWHPSSNSNLGSNKQTEAWAIALSEDARYLAGTTHDGHIKVWDLSSSGEQIRDFETKGSFGACIDMVSYVKDG